MQLAEWLLVLATRHDRAKDEHEDEQKEYQMRAKMKGGLRSFKMSYDDETELLKGVIGHVRGKPACLKKLSPAAIGSLAYVLSAKVASDPLIEGHEIVEKLVIDPEKTIDYLNSLQELKKLGWIRLIENSGTSFTDQPPFSYLQAYIELGETFHKEMGVSQFDTRSFTNNDAYLDAVYAYLQTVINDDSQLYRVHDPDANLSLYQPEGWFRRIALIAQNTTCELPAEETKKKYSLSMLQYLALVGLLGMRDGDLTYDFSSPPDVTRLFAQGRVCRKRMQDHLYGDKSPLIRDRLLEGSHSAFGESVQLTQLGSKALLGKQAGKITTKELASKIKKHTLFDFEEPKVKKDSVQLPPPVMEAIRSIIFGESPQGKKIRKEWNTSFPATYGTPTGSAVLLYGPPGTGKTLCAQYLASEMKLPLLKVDASKVLSCWVGESEQNVSRLFSSYADIQKELGVSPVLLFNEADQLLGSRDAGSNSVDRMQNNMQNLFLEGLERFSGILVATTNRRDLLDNAFSRRFSHKLELPPPDRHLRMELWKVHLPLQRLAEDVDIGQLADMGLTGGEIRLVIERSVRLMAFRGVTTLDIKTLTDIAREELNSRLKRNGAVGKIGFGAGSN